MTGVQYILINEGIIPILYTHNFNVAANKSYKNIGFIEVGRITNIIFKYF